MTRATTPYAQVGMGNSTRSCSTAVSSNDMEFSVQTKESLAGEPPETV
jgi:hypothetical protein